MEAGLTPQLPFATNDVIITINLHFTPGRCQIWGSIVFGAERLMGTAFSGSHPNDLQEIY